MFISIRVYDPKYTEHQKKLITSSERHTIKSKALTQIIIGHRLAIILLTKHIKNKLCVLESKENKIRWNCKRSFSEITETARLPGTELGTHNSQYGSYITCLWNWMTCYWMFWIGGLSWRFSARSFCDFWKATCCDFIAFSPFWAKAIF